MPNFVAYTTRALVSSMFSATLSMFSSAFVMIFILRSNNKLRDAYHRIMFFMSFWDFVSSFAVALTTLPMPSDVHTVYDFAGKAFGTIWTCEAQAFLFVIGSGFTISANCVLNLYYVFTIWLGIREERFNKIFLPIFLVASIVLTIPAAIILLNQDLLNPVPYYPYCSVGMYPAGCLVEEDTECIRGDDPASRSVRSQFEMSLGIYLSSGVVLISVSMVLVISAVFRIEIKQRNAIRRANEGRSEYNGESGNSNNNNGDFQRTRAVLHQGLMYIAAFLLTWTWVILAVVTPKSVNHKVTDSLKFIFQPLQGFFNAFIFAYSKAKILKKASRGRLTFWQSMKKVIVSPKAVPDIIVSSLEMIELDQPGRQPARTGITLQNDDDDQPISVLDSMGTPSIPMNASAFRGGMASQQHQIPDNDDDVKANMETRNDAEEAFHEDRLCSDDVFEDESGCKSNTKGSRYGGDHSIGGFLSFASSKFSVSQSNDNTSRLESKVRGNHSTSGILSWATSSRRSEASQTEIEESRQGRKLSSGDSKISFGSS